jgi:YidC/Oxa1 family membrane protein insertase
MISAVFNEIFFRPLFNVLVFLTGILPWHDLGLAVILLTVGARFLIFPLTHRAAKTQNQMKILEPELKKIKNEIKDREEQARLTMELYKKHGINPFSSVFFTFLQLPILIALYLVFRENLISNAGHLYSFISFPAAIHTNFLGFIELSRPSVFLAVLAGISQFFQMKLAQPPKNPVEKKETPDFARLLGLQMTYFMPVFLIIIALRFPAAVSLYWTTVSLFAIVHEGIVRKKAKKIYDRGNQANFGNNSSLV